MTTLRPGRLTAAAKKFLMWDPNPAVFGITIPCPVPVSMGLDDARGLINALIDTHESLRSRYSYGLDATVFIEPESRGEIDTARVDVREVDIEQVAGDAIPQIMEVETAKSNLRLDPTTGKIVTAALLTRSTDVNILLLTVHHIAIDGVAMWVMWEDVATYARQWEAGEEISLPREPITGSEWAAFLDEYSLTRTGDLDYWMAASDIEPHIETRPATPESAYLDEVIDGALAVRLLDELPAALGASYTRILLVALGLAIEDVTGVARPIQVQKHGRYSRLRPGTDLSRTVAWLSDDYPWLVRPVAGSHGERMRDAIANYPANPEDFTLLFWHHPDSWSRMVEFNVPKFYFNFLGDVGVWIPGAHSREQARLTVFDLSMFLGASENDGVRAVHYSVHSPTGGIGLDRVKEIVTRWISILETVEV
ncbi:condensation domain-containing protein [Nocardia sp. NBC_01503]|uniref:condensation domain-containing protein n=1 Tax=Nocardia sp. NBC_01503 TaxID=2975997 RepID=UPI002E7B7838|nr:condensation domain-containing protein [Nocardia sp. NBC_01503]WTL35657.1 condensation domain-containing protein [Nocardia sp. NBC_01503]